MNRIVLPMLTLGLLHTFTLWGCSAVASPQPSNRVTERARQG